MAAECAQIAVVAAAEAVALVEVPAAPAAAVAPPPYYAGWNSSTGVEKQPVAFVEASSTRVEGPPSASAGVEGIHFPLVRF